MGYSTPHPKGHTLNSSSLIRFHLFVSSLRGFGGVEGFDHSFSHCHRRGAYLMAIHKDYLTWSLRAPKQGDD
jgi:hypothetical protein